MGNTQISQTSGLNKQDGIDNKDENIMSSFPHKQILLNFPDIEKKLQLDLLAGDISFKNFQEEFENEMKIPPDVEINYFKSKPSLPGKEIVRPDELISNVPSEIYLEILKKGNRLKHLNLSLTIMKKDTIEVSSLKTYSFIPLKYSVGFLNRPIYKAGESFRLFRATDTTLSDPLDFEKSLADYEILDEEANLIVYYPNESEILSIKIFSQKTKYSVEADKYMRISELTEIYNKEAKGFYVLRENDQGIKLYENFTLEKLYNQTGKSASLIAEEYKDYYKKRIRISRENPLEKEEVQTNLLEIPD